MYGAGDSGKSEGVPSGTLVDGYRFLKELGRGSGGIVHLVYNHALKRWEALKLMAHGAQCPEEVRRFIEDARAAAGVDHPNVVKIYAFGTLSYAGGLRPYFTMAYFPRGTLRESLRRFRDPCAAVQVMVPILNGVEAAHENQLIHRDLKPDNILLRIDDQPCVADFGLARNLKELTGPSGGSGTFGYMSPEQARREGLKFDSDVFSLGVILYELITGKVPYSGLTPSEQLARLSSPQPIRSPIEVDDRIPSALAHVCSKAISKDRSDRYPSVAAFRIELERALHVRPLASSVVVAPALRQRAFRSTRIGRRDALVLGGMGALLVSSGLVRSHTRSTAGNLHSHAERLAESTLALLRARAGSIARAARDVSIRELVYNDWLDKPEPAVLAEFGAGFDGLLVLDSSGQPRAHFHGNGTPHNHFERTFTHRDYFQSARQLGDIAHPGVCVSRLLRSEVDGHIKLGISAPILDASGAWWRGVLTGFIKASSSFGLVGLPHTDGQVLSAMLGPRDTDQRNVRPPRGFSVFAHERLVETQEHALEEQVCRTFEQQFGAPAPPARHFTSPSAKCTSLSNYRDPVPGYDGPWAGVAAAPVGNTGYVVVAQNR